MRASLHFDRTQDPFPKFSHANSLPRAIAHYQSACQVDAHRFEAVCWCTINCWMPDGSTLELELEGSSAKAGFFFSRRNLPTLGMNVTVSRPLIWFWNLYAFCCRGLNQSPEPKPCVRMSRSRSLYVVKEQSDVSVGMHQTLARPANEDTAPHTCRLRDGLQAVAIMCMLACLENGKTMREWPPYLPSKPRYFRHLSYRRPVAYSVDRNSPKVCLSQNTPQGGFQRDKLVGQSR